MGVGVLYNYRIAVCDDEELALVQIAEVVKKEFAKIEISAEINTALIFQFNQY